MPELLHECGKTVRFPSGTEGKKGKCPHCGGQILVPGADAPLAQHQITLDPPVHWKDYQDYFDGTGPAPRPMVLPNKLMLQAEADERWERQAESRPSRFHCPVCRNRINVDQVICTKCGLDYRTGLVLGKNQRLNEKGINYLRDIPWLVEARRAMEDEPPEPKEKDNSLRAKAPRKRRKTSRTRRLR
ncbi:MAG: hypothetical protein JKY65_31110 [Planctomycetes bacterium]|nr:hypothetical protein [Planctomycetota bacterium]